MPCRSPTMRGSAVATIWVSRMARNAASMHPVMVGVMRVPEEWSPPVARAVGTDMMSRLSSRCVRSPSHRPLEAAASSFRGPVRGLRGGHFVVVQWVGGTAGPAGVRAGRGLAELRDQHDLAELGTGLHQLVGRDGLLQRQPLVDHGLDLAGGDEVEQVA